MEWLLRPMQRPRRRVPRCKNIQTKRRRRLWWRTGTTCACNHHRRRRQNNNNNKYNNKYKRYVLDARASPRARGTNPKQHRTPPCARRVTAWKRWNWSIKNATRAKRRKRAGSGTSRKSPSATCARGAIGSNWSRCNTRRASRARAKRPVDTGIRVNSYRTGICVIIVTGRWVSRRRSFASPFRAKRVFFSSLSLLILKHWPLKT